MNERRAKDLIYDERIQVQPFSCFFLVPNVNFRLTNTPVLFESSLSQACFQSFLDCLRDWDRIHQITHKMLEL